MSADCIPCWKGLNLYLSWKYCEGCWCDIDGDGGPIVLVFAIHCCLQSIIDHLHTWECMKNNLKNTISKAPAKRHKNNVNLTVSRLTCFLTSWFSHRFTTKVVNIKALNKFILRSWKLCVKNKRLSTICFLTWIMMILQVLNPDLQQGWPWVYRSCVCQPRAWLPFSPSLSEGKLKQKTCNLENPWLVTLNL